MIIWFEEAGSIPQSAWDKLANDLTLSNEQIANKLATFELIRTAPHRSNLLHWRKDKRRRNQIKQAMRKLYKRQGK